MAPAWRLSGSGIIFATLGAIALSSIAAPGRLAAPEQADRLVQGPARSIAAAAASGGPARYLQRTDLMGRRSDVPRTDPVERRPLLTFTQLTDIHLIDEESPLRTEFLDSMLGTAYRPQEGLGPHVLAWMAHLARTMNSPVTGHPSKLVITTGDSSDNSQRNEVRWLIDILDGGPVDPDSGVPGTCGVVDDRRRYHGVSRGVAPEVLERMNLPFTSDGVGQPWYAAFGNHDGLVSGNVPLGPGMVALATGCRKVLDLPPQQIASIADAGQVDGRDGLLRDAITEMSVWAAREVVDGSQVRVVPSDPDRRPLTQSEYIREHFATTGTPIGHGFGEANLASGHAWYSFLPVPGVRFIALDTVSPTGGHSGAIVDEQFQWLHAELLDAERREQLVLLYGHHTLRTITQPADTVFAAAAGTPLPLVHHGWSDGGVADCATWDASAEPTETETLGCLLLRHPGAIAYIDGHEHRNLIGPVLRPAAAGREGGFWEITTASHIDWPQEARLLDLVANPEGTLSIFATSFGLPAVPDATTGADGSVERLAAVAHQLAYDDPQASGWRNGGPSAAGERRDRDVELVVPDPYR